MPAQTTHIPTFKLGSLLKKLKRLQKKAAKYGNEDIQFTVGDAFTKTHKDEYGRKVVISYTPLTVSGEAPVYENGWSLLARVELFGEENLVHRVPGNEDNLDGRFRTHGNVCEHCQKARRRNDVYVFEKDGEQIAVGRTCLRDFIGCDDPKLIVARAEFFEALQEQEEDDLLNFGPGNHSLLNIADYTAAVTREDGYISKSKALDESIQSTSDIVRDAASGRKTVKVEDIDRETAEAAIEWFRNSEGFNNEFLDNCRIIFKTDLIKDKHFNLVVAAIWSYKRHLAAEASRCEEAENSDFVGEVKERLRDINVTFEKSIYLGFGMYGDRRLHVLKGETGNTFVWFTGNMIDAELGDTITLDGTVKEHKDFKGVKQTVLTRVKVKS